MNKYIRLGLLTALIISFLGNNDICASDSGSIGRGFNLIQTAKEVKEKPMMKALINVVQDNSKMIAALVVLGFASRQYYIWKKRPKDDDISPEAKARRSNEIVDLKNGYSLYKRLTLLISFIDDFYVFGRRTKGSPIKIKTKLADGSVEISEDYKVLIKGYGPLTFIYDRVLWDIENLLKFMGTLGSAFLILDSVLAGDARPLVSGVENKK